MSFARIYKIDKDTLAEVSHEELNFSNVSGLIIQHIHDATISNANSINFSINITNNYVPNIEDEEIMIVIREKVDMTSKGPHNQKITESGKDIGKVNYKNKKPQTPWELPDGFEQIKDKNE